MNTKPTEGSATASLILGLFGLIAWFIPLFGLPITITGLVQGIKGLESSNRGVATAGVVLCGIGLFLSAINFVAGFYMGATGQHQLVNQMMRR